LVNMVLELSIWADGVEELFWVNMGDGVWWRSTRLGWLAWGVVDILGGAPFF
jgi:hypothetical protein